MQRFQAHNYKIPKLWSFKTSKPPVAEDMKILNQGLKNKTPAYNIYSLTN